MGKGQGSDTGDFIKLATSTVGAVGGGMVAGPAGAAQGWDAGQSVGSFGNKMVGANETGQGIVGQANKWGSAASGVVGMGSNIAQGMNSVAAKTPATDATKGFSGIVSPSGSGQGTTGVDVGFGKALAGNPTVPTASGYDKMSNIMSKITDTAGAIQKVGGAAGSMFGDQSSGMENNLQPMQMTQPSQMVAPNMLNQVLATQLMNPASQNRLAFNHYGRM